MEINNVDSHLVMTTMADNISGQLFHLEMGRRLFSFATLWRSAFLSFLIVSI